MSEEITTDLIGALDLYDYSSCLCVSSDESYRSLLAALDLGWQVEEPVYLRPRWGEGEPWVFHFILKMNTMCQPHLVTVRRMITVRWSLDVELLALQEGWLVDRIVRIGAAGEQVASPGAGR